jgi:hypothetical protein
MSDITLPPGSPTDLGRPRPDVGRWAFEHVRQLGNVKIRPVLPATPNMNTLNGWAWFTSLQVDCRANTMDRAYQMADQARRILTALPWETWDAGVVGVVEEADGPNWSPDENGGPRYLFRMRFSCHLARRR